MYYACMHDAPYAWIMHLIHIRPTRVMKTCSRCNACTHVHANVCVQSAGRYTIIRAWMTLNLNAYWLIHRFMFYDWTTRDELIIIFRDAAAAVCAADVVVAAPMLMLLLPPLLLILLLPFLLFSCCCRGSRWSCCCNCGPPFCCSCPCCCCCFCPCSSWCFPAAAPMLLLLPLLLPLHPPCSCICFLQCISEPGAERETTWKSFIKVLLEVRSSLAPPFFFILQDSGSSSSSQKHLAWCLIACDFPTLLRPSPIRQCGHALFRSSSRFAADLAHVSLTFLAFPGVQWNIYVPRADKQSVGSNSGGAPGHHSNRLIRLHSYNSSPT